MAVQTPNIITEGRMGNRLVLTGTFSATTGDSVAITDGKSRLISCWAINSDGDESCSLVLNADTSTEDSQNGSIFITHAGGAGDTWNFEATLV